MEASDKDLIIVKYRKRSRMMSLIAGVMVFLTFIFFVYAFVQKGIADEMQRVAYENASKLNKCAEEAMRQREMAERAAEEARHAQYQTEAALQKH